MSDDAAAGAASVPAPATTSTTGSPPAKRIKTAVSELSSAPALTTTASTDSIDTTMATTDEIPPAPAAPVTVPLISGADIAGPVPLLVKRLSDDARVPTRGSAQSAGYDLYASRATTVPARGKVLVDTDLSIAVPVGTYGRIAPRSGLASKNFIDTGAGVIDADYRGPVKVLLFNHADADFEVAQDDRIAQLVLERIWTPEVIEVPELENSVRGAGGFGSTGTN